jgi:drug/metabolite transporter (DMT)-like permease
MPGDKIARRRGVLLVLGATVLWSLAGYFTRRVSHLDMGTVLFWRAAFGGFCIYIWGIVEWKQGRLGPNLGFGRIAPLLIPLSAVAISSYVAAIMLTTVADVLVIYATLPFVAAGMAFVITGERPSQRTLAAAGIALVGVLIMVANGLGSGRLAGQGLALVMTVAFGLMVVLQRRDPAMSMTTINGTAAFVAAGIGFAMAKNPAIGFADAATLFVFGLTTICVAFVMFMEGAKFIPAAESGLIGMLDVGLGPLWVFLAFGENPGVATIIGAAFVLGAIVWRMIPELRSAPA